ncbi:MAG: DUF932 domain-containing protein, partial [Nitrosopumilus sp.]
HKLGVRVEKEVTAEAAIRLAGLDTTVELRPLFIQTKDSKHNEVDDKKAVVRTDDDRVLGVVGNQYHPVQNVELFGFMDAIVGEGQAIYHTAGSLFDGKKVFLTCKLPTSLTIGPDKIDKYLLLTSAHDGSMAIHCMFTPVRVVCSNTLSAALGSYVGGTGVNKRAKSTVQIKHTKNYKSGISDARNALGLAEYYYEQLGITFEKLLNYKFTDSNMEEYVQLLLPGKILENGKNEAKTRTKNLRDKICDLFHNGAGQKDVTNTAWAAYNATTEYADHYRVIRVREDKKLEDVRFQSLLLGSSALFKQNAFDLIMEQVNKENSAVVVAVNGGKDEN